MNLVSHLETLVSISLASFEDQVGAILFLEQSRIRFELINRLKIMPNFLLKTVTSIEREFVETIEEGAEEILSHSATMMRALAEAKRNDAAIPDELVKLPKSSHSELTATLATAEKRETTEVSQRFAVMMKKIEVFLERLEGSDCPQPARNTRPCGPCFGGLFYTMY
jgi:hypothetical protein